MAHDSGSELTAYGLSLTTRGRAAEWLTSLLVGCGSAALSYLLDTHILIWWLGADRRLSKQQRKALATASPDEPLVVSDISLWEVATLHDLGRIELDLPLRDWLERAVAAPLVRRQGITPAVAAEIAVLPSSFHRDPADRVLVATARVLGLSLLTSDRLILQAELVPTVG